MSFKEVLRIEHTKLYPTPLHLKWTSLSLCIKEGSLLWTNHKFIKNKWTWQGNSTSADITDKYMKTTRKRHKNTYKWASSPENLSFTVCEQQRRRPVRLISAFVIRLLESIISKLDTSKISLFELVSVAEQAAFCMTWSETPKTGYLAHVDA